MRRLLVSILLVALAATAVGSYIQARRIDAESDPGWAAEEGPPARVVATPLLSVRRTPSWLSAPVIEARLLEQISEVADQPGAPPQTCLAVYRNDEPIVRQRAGTPLVPAALMQIVTGAVILEAAGPAATYTTEVFVRRDALEAAAGGVLTADLYLVGRGDPVLSTLAYVGRFDEPIAFTDFAELAVKTAASLRNLGIARVEGAVLADETRFPEAERDYTAQIVQPDSLPIWKESYVASNQAGPLSGLLLNDGYVSFPADAGPTQNVRADDPGLHAAQVLDGLIEARGVPVSVEAATGTAPPVSELVSLGDVESPPMAEIVARMLRQSDNTTAEMLLKEIGRRSWGSARAEAVVGAHDVLQRQLGMPTAGVVISDGSGLSVHNRLTCDLVAGLLLQAGPDSPLVQGLAVVGESGTLRDCEVGPDPSTGAAPAPVPGEGAVAPDLPTGTVWAKTGTLDDVSALAGMTVARNGDVLTFALISNREGLSLDNCNQLQKDLIAAVVGHPYGPSSADAALQPRPAYSPVIDTGPGPDEDVDP